MCDTRRNAERKCNRMLSASDISPFFLFAPSSFSLKDNLLSHPLPHLSFQVEKTDRNRKQKKEKEKVEKTDRNRKQKKEKEKVEKTDRNRKQKKEKEKVEKTDSNRKQKKEKEKVEKTNRNRKQKEEKEKVEKTDRNRKQKEGKEKVEKTDRNRKHWTEFRSQPIKSPREVIVSDPKAFPQGTYVTVPDGVLGNLAVWGDSIHTRPEVRSLSMNIRDCVFEDEDFGQHLRKEYNQENCIYECYRKYVIKYCGCVPDFLFLDSLTQPPAEPCNVEGLLCLSAFNEQLNYLQPASKSQLEEDEEEGMVCDCPKDCNSHEYVTELFSAFGTGNRSKIILDVFFRLSYCVLYETGITNDWLTTIVSFGGIAGLFLGASLLSFAELLYFLTIRLYCIWTASHSSNQRTCRIKVDKKDTALY
ncbi:uncharacterized protein [Halyomorpha halys]|uniref:uncharacterized protein n=1 Tax=Halyomorpha halys TaxID=286706 RepID=UPI0034D235A2